MGLIERFKSKNWQMPEDSLSRIIESYVLSGELISQVLKETPFIPYTPKLKREKLEEEEILAWISYLKETPLSYLSKVYFRPEYSGTENIPQDSGAVLAGNHTSLIPWDGFYAYLGVVKYAGRVPYGVGFSMLENNSDLLRTIGTVFREREAVKELLKNDKLVLILPEGAHGVAKPWWKRNQVVPKGGFRGKGYLKLSLETKKPIIPMGISGAASIHLCIGDGLPLAKMVADIFLRSKPLGKTRFGQRLLELVDNTNAFPISLNLLPLPAKIKVHYGEPIHFYENLPDFSLEEYGRLQLKYNEFSLSESERERFHFLDDRLREMNQEVMLAIEKNIAYL